MKFVYSVSLCLYFFRLLVPKPNLEEEKNVFIQANSLIILTSLNPVLLALGFEQVG